MSSKHAFPLKAVIVLPNWLGAMLAEIDTQTVFATDSERMSFVIKLARRNVEEGTGGPFGAAVFDSATGRLIAAGVNLVDSANCSVAHAEMVAIMLAQRAAGSHDLSQGGARRELFSSTEPCAMCLGAIPWSGVKRLVCAARDEDARAVGFDEGHKPTDWPAGLEERGIRVKQDLMREDATQVLKDYIKRGGPIYNPE
jgi:tRNA(Arg) A34 adenosine deaminase TadA